ncbi:MAG: hypothetical protein EHM45_16870 [Desulfobacteraceae bacterium]|nr:MAG: hypothetical protein EHM45_16870 [Desulfobacteraceae bacterium]
MKRKILWTVLFVVLIGSLFLRQPLTNLHEDKTAPVSEAPSLKSIRNHIEPGETLSSIFKKYGLRMEELFAMKSAAAGIHSLQQLRPGKPYSITIDEQNLVNSFTYGIDDSTILKIELVENVFQAQKCAIPYETRLLTIGGFIEGNLISAVGPEKEDYLLALRIADIFGWDIDFNIDLRTGDSFRVIVEGLYLNEEFRRYGKILSVEFINNRQTYAAYLFEYEGKADYYDAEGNSLRKAFLKAPLSFRRISSVYTKKRLHPILRVYRPHHGIDYVAAKGTPVSATADGMVRFAGYKGHYGKLVVIAHANGYETYYGHLSRMGSDIRKGTRVKQGDLIGYVGTTGLSTGPHLHYEMKQGRISVNPLGIKNVSGEPVAAAQKAEFIKQVQALDKMYTAAVFYDAQDTERKKYSLQRTPDADYNALTKTKRQGG